MRGENLDTGAAVTGVIEHVMVWTDPRQALGVHHLGTRPHVYGK